MIPLITSTELEKIGITKEELLSKFNTQLIKDFERGGLENYLQPLVSFEYNDIRQQLNKTLSEILDKESSKYQPLLYLIDISEKDISTIFNQQNNDRILTIADLIIKRILQKVVLKLVG